MSKPLYWIGSVILLIAMTNSGAAIACAIREPGQTVPSLVLPLAKPSSWEQEDYYISLLKMILARTETKFGPCEIDQTENMLTRARSAALIDRDQGVDLFWATTSIEREELLQAIPIPLLKGLMGHKLLLIEKDHQHLFSDVHTLEQLQKLRAGQGTDWPDVSILRANGIRVVTSTNYEALYKMLAGGRFDFLPRGANQILSEWRHNSDKDIVMEKELVLVYPAPVYFFVKKDNQELAQRIEIGLKSMIEDGSFDIHFYSHPLILDTLANTRIKNRRPIYLHNHILPPGTPLEPMEDWTHPWIKPEGPRRP